MGRSSNLYSQIIKEIFFLSYKKDITSFVFGRDEIAVASEKLGVDTPKNIGDLIYSFRYRNPLPESILKTANKGLEWVIFPAGRAQYEFRLVKVNHITPNENLVNIKILDSTPEIIIKHALNDEQALLAILRYNRLIDIFLGIAAFSLQNHLRTTVKKIGQIEIDEVYVGVDKLGRHFIIPVQAKGGKDQLSVVQTTQDIEFCSEKYPELICKAVSAQFVNDKEIALFDLSLIDGMIKIVDEKHYMLVDKDSISKEELLELKNK